MKLKEHKIAIILGIVGLLIPLGLTFINEFFFLLILINPIVIAVIIYIGSLFLTIFNISALELNLATMIYICFISLLYYSVIGHFIDKAIKNKEKRKKILAILITSLIILNGIGFWLILSSKLGSLPV